MLRVLPAARSGALTGILLSLAIPVGETAPLLVILVVLAINIVARRFLSSRAA